VPRKIFGPKWKEIRRGLRQLYKEDPHYLCSSSTRLILSDDQIKTDKLGGSCGTRRGKRNACKVLVRRPEEKMIL
jgi:hypothetical protein